MKFIADLKVIFPAGDFPLSASQAANNLDLIETTGIE